MKIFLTGGSGYIGTRFINLACKKGHQIFAVTRKRKKNKKNLIWLKGKISKNWKQLKNCDFLVHMAAAGVSDQNLSFKKCMDVNFIQSVQLLINAKNAGCNNWIIIGSSSEYGDTLKINKKVSINSPKKPNNNYSLTKFLFSQTALFLAKKFKVNCRYARIFQVYGDNEKKNRLTSSLISTLKKKNKYFYINFPDAIRDFIRVDEVAKKILEMTNFKKKITIETWHIGSGKPMRIKDFIYKFIEKNFSKEKIYRAKFKNNKKIVNENHVSNLKDLWG